MTLRVDILWRILKKNCKKIYFTGPKKAKFFGVINLEHRFSLPVTSFLTF